MKRSYEIESDGDRWRLTMYENGVEVGRAHAGEEDYDWLLERATEFLGPVVPAQRSSAAARIATLLRALKDRVASPFEAASRWLPWWFQNGAVALLSWFVLKFVDKPSVLKLINNVQPKLRVPGVGESKCSLQLALLVSYADSSTLLFDLTHGRFLKLKVPHQVSVKGGDLFFFDQGSFDHPVSHVPFNRMLYRVARVIFKPAQVAFPSERTF